MVGPVRFDGLASGIDYTSIIEKLLSIQKKPITNLQSQVQKTTEKSTALSQVNAGLLGLKGVFDNLARPSFWARTKATSSNESVLKATGDQISSTGAFPFTVKRLAQSHQLISNGFPDSTTTSLTSADTTLRVELGGGFLDRKAPITFLNGQTGIDRGSIKITDAGGKVAVVNLEHVTNVQDVLDAINNNTQASVQASVAGDRIVVKNLAAGAGTLQVENYGADLTATTLGIDGVALTVGVSQFVFGKDVNFATGSTPLDLLNDGLGVSSVTGDDLRIVLRNASAVIDVDLNSDMTVAQVVNAINTDSQNPGTLAASLSPDGTRIVLTDTSALVARTVDSGTSTTQFTDAALIGLPANSLVGARIKMITGPTGQARITAFNNATGAVTVDTAFSGVPAAGNQYRIALSVGALNGSFAAANLGLAKIDPATGQFFTPAGETTTTGVSDEFAETVTTSNRIVGDRFLPELNSTLRSQLRGGPTNTTAGELKGVRDGTVSFTDRSGATATLNLSSRVATTVTSSTATSVTVASAAGMAVGNRIRIQTSSGIQERTVTSISGSTISFDQSITGVSGGNGVFANNESLIDITRNVNDRLQAAGVKIRVDIDSETNGLWVTDSSGGSGALSVADVTGSAASDLGITGSVAANTINGADLDPQWIGERTLLSGLNGGTGVQAGKFRVTDKVGVQFEVDLSQSTDRYIQSVIRDGNAAAAAAGSTVRFSINDTGDGLLVADGSPTVGTLKIEEVNNGRTARDLNILGSAPAATPGIINGSFEFSIDIKAGSKLQDVANAINAKGLPVQAAVLKDGSGVNPFKITLLSKRSGEAGRLVVDSDLTGLSFSTTSAAQNSLLLYGSNGGPTDPAVISNSGNSVTNLVQGMTVQLISPSDSPVTVTVAKDVDGLSKQGEKLVESYNSTLSKIRELASFNSSTLKAGPLFADPTVQRIRRDLADFITQPVTDIASGNLNTLPAVGFGVTAEAGLTLDSSKFSSLLQTSFDQMETLFTLQRPLKLNTALSDLNKGLGLHDMAGDDFTIYARSATKQLAIDVSGLSTISDLLQKINNATGNNGTITATIAADGYSLQLDDSSATPTRAVSAPTTINSFVAPDADIDPLADGFLIGATVTFLTGANAGEVRKVSGFSTATNAITLDSNLLSAPSAGDTYRLERELEVKKVGLATAASELKLESKTSLGQNVLKGGTINLNGDPGAAARATERLDVITRSDDGIISTRTDGLDDKVKGLNKSIERINERVKKMEERLIREFSQLEVVLARSQQTISRLQSSLLAFVGMMGSAAGKTRL